MQQDGVESLQSNRESLEEKLSLLVIGRDRSDSWPRSFKKSTADSLTGPRVSKAISWNMCDSESAAHLAHFLDAAISAAAPADDADAKIYESARVVATVMSHVRDRPLCQGINVTPRQGVCRHYAVTTKETRRFLHVWNFG